MIDLSKLIAARALLAKPGGWTQGAFARDSKNFAVPSYAPNAVCFCLAGACNAAGVSLFAIPSSAVENLSIAHFNDTPGRTQAEVVAVLDAVIAANTPGQPTGDAQ